MKGKFPESLLICFLCGVVATPFFPALRGEFTNWDDQVTITENLYLSQGFHDGLVPLLTQDRFGLYVPVTYLVYWLKFHYFGGEPFGFHLINLLFHIANVLLVYLVFRKLLGAKLPAGIASLWWAMHPLHAEPVSWVTGLKDVLSAFLMLVSLCLYMAWRGREPEAAEKRSRKRRSKWWLWCSSWMAFLLAGFSKPGVVAFPIVLLTYDIFVIRRRWRKLWAVIPYLAVSALVVFITMKVQNPEEAGIRGQSIVNRLRLAGDSSMFYLGKLAWPAGLCAVYGRTVDEVVKSPWSWLSLIAASVLYVVAILPGKIWRLGVAIFIAGLAPVSGIVAFSYQTHSTVADRYIYFSAVGVALILGDFVSRFSFGQGKRPGVVGAIAALAVTLWAVGLACVSWNQAETWRDSVKLWQRVVDVKPDLAEGYGNRGAAWGAKGDYVKEIEDSSQAIKLNPRYVLAYSNRGVAKAQMGDFRGAIEDYTHAIELKRDHAEAYCGRGAAYTNIGEYNLAIRDSTRAIELNPNLAEAYNNRGIAWESKRDYRNAIDDYTNALRIKPACASIYYNRSVAFGLNNMYKEALSDIRRYIDLGGSVDPERMEFLKKKAGEW